MNRSKLEEVLKKEIGIEYIEVQNVVNRILDKKKGQDD